MKNSKGCEFFERRG